MPDTPRGLTLEAIGKLAGISRSMVSRVLNEHPDVRPEVRTRIEAVIEKTGYLPNQAARARVQPDRLDRPRHVDRRRRAIHLTL